MTAWLIAAAAGVAAALLQYGQLGAPSVGKRAGLGALRALALALIVGLIMDAPIGFARPVPPWVFVDASQSMTRAGSVLDATAWDSAAALRTDSIWVFGDTLHPASPGQPATAPRTRLRDVVERTTVAGRPVVLFTDGETGDSAALDGLPGGSRIVVLERAPRRDAALASLTVPRAAVEGDSIAVRLVVRAGNAGAESGAVTLMLGGRSLGRWPVESLPAWGERQLDVRVRASEGGGGAATQGASILRAVVITAQDAEPRNDTLAATLELSRAASAVFVSTSPDQDSRFAMAVLRGALALPTRGFLRVAPGTWRHEGSLTPATEQLVREAMRAAPVAILHGDTAMFGSPRAATLGPLALMVPADENAGEWYVASVPPSPLAPALAGLALDSLPPVAAGPSGGGDWVALEARRGREPARRPVVTGFDAPRRVVTVTASGFWRWRFRGGASADAYVALWGSIFDWLAAERADRRAAVPDVNVVRAGEPIRWRRGSSADSSVQIRLARRDVSEEDTLTLRFDAGTAVQESEPLAPGVYDVSVPGGSTVLVVNASPELLPSRPTLRSGQGGRGASVGDAPRARDNGWLYALAIALLCGEWFVRRRAGLR